MAVFTSNQVNHVYVAKAVQSSTLSSNGDIICKKTADGEIYFLYKNAEGQIVRSDLIPIKNIMWAKVIGGNNPSQKRGLKQYVVWVPTIDTDASHAKNDIGKTFCLTFEITLHEGIETVYRKQAFAIIKASDSKGDVIDTLLESLNRNFEKDDYVKDLFTFAKTTASVGGSSQAVLTVTERSQSSKYKVGLYANNGVNFTLSSEEFNIEKPTNASYIGNSYDIADLEYFALGERGDVYRNIGWPNANPSKTTMGASDIGDSISYNILNIHFAFTDSNEGVQKSEKDITIAIKMTDPTSSTGGYGVGALNDLSRQFAFNVLGPGGSGNGGSDSNYSFDLVDTSGTSAHNQATNIKDLSSFFFK